MWDGSEYLRGERIVGECCQCFALLVFAPDYTLFFVFSFSQLFPSDHLPIGLIASLKAVKIVKEINEKMNLEMKMEGQIENASISEIEINPLAENKVEAVIESVFDSKAASSFQ